MEARCTVDTLCTLLFHLRVHIVRGSSRTQGRFVVASGQDDVVVSPVAEPPAKTQTNQLPLRQQTLSSNVVLGRGPASAEFAVFSPCSQPSTSLALSECSSDTVSSPSVQPYCTNLVALSTFR